MRIKGYNDFHEGWLAALLLRPFNDNQTEGWKEGWHTATETGESALFALQKEIRIGHIKVTED